MNSIMTIPQKEAAYILIGDGWRIKSIVNGLYRNTTVKMVRNDSWLVISPSGNVKFNSKQQKGQGGGGEVRSWPG